MNRFALVALWGLCALSACARPTSIVARPATAATVRPGITVLVRDSMHLIAGRRIGLITNQSGLDETGRSSIDVLSDERARAAGVKLVRLFAPEHGIRGTEDRAIPNEVDQKTGIVIVSLYGNPALGVGGTAAPPDSLLRDLDAIVVDLQDIGTRTWTYVGLMLYSMYSSARLGIPVIVIDRPNPISGAHASAPLLDTARAIPTPPAPGRPGRAYALYPTPLRHRMTMGEMARYFDAELHLNSKLTVIPMTGWRRSMWFDQTGLPWVKPSPNMPDITSALLYPALVPFEGSNLSVGRGMPDPFQRFGAPWMDAPRVARMLSDRRIPGVTFVVDSFTPQANKFAGQKIAGVRMVVENREIVPAGLLSASILWVLARVNPDSLRITAGTFDDRFGSPAAREALMRGEDPAVVMARLQPATDAFNKRVQSFWLYR